MDMDATMDMAGSLLNHTARILLAPGSDQSLTRPTGGIGGSVLDFFLCFFPLIFLVAVTLIKPIQMQTSVSLPVAALMLWLFRMVYFANPPNFINALVLAGFLEALTPLSIIFGAILLFQTMHHTKCLPWMMGQIKGLSGGHPVAEVFLISWAFAYLIEGASGFGTPVALSAPMLAELGHDPIKTVTCGLIMNTLATQFGAVGTPIWYGFGGIGLTDEELVKVGFQSAIIVGATAYLIPILAASFLIPIKDLLRNWLFVLLSITSAVLPSIGLSIFNYEFPSLIAGMCALILTAVLIFFNVGLRPCSHQYQGGDEFEEEDTEVVQGNTLSVVEGIGVVKLPAYATLSFQLGLDRQRKQMCDASVGVNLDDPQGYEAKVTGRRVSRMPARVASKLSGADEEMKNLSISEEGVSSSELGEDVWQKTAKSYGGGDIMVSPLDPNVAVNKPALTVKSAIFRTFPLWCTILLLLITRIPQLKIKPILQSTTPQVCLNLNSLGEFCTSYSLVLQVMGILTEPEVNWKYEILYIPFFIPFTVVSLATIAMFFWDFDKGVRLWVPFLEAGNRVKAAVLPTLGALVLVQLIRYGGFTSPSYIIGYWLSEWLGVFFIMLSAYLGALGSFFSGSTTVSNLTFGSIQKIAAQSIHKPYTTMLAIQTLGATMGNMICINNIISAKAVMNLNHISEGIFIARTGPVALLMGAMGEALGFGLMFLGFP